MKRVVLDTNVVVSAILWGGTPRQFFNLADAGQITLFTSIELLRELMTYCSASLLNALASAADQVPFSFNELLARRSAQG